MALNPKQERFCLEYLVDSNATQAAIRAGYAAKHADVTGPRLLGNVGIAAKIRAALAKAEEESGVTREWALKRLHETAERCAQAEPVRDRTGHIVVGEWQFREAGVVSAVSAIAKLQGWNAPAEVEGKLEVVVRRGGTHST